MDKERRKQLKESYKNAKSSMGVYQIKNTKTGKAYVGITQDLKGTMNGNFFKLEGGIFKDRELLSEWKEYGRENFEQTILAELEYDKDETKVDYTEDLLLLRELVTEKDLNKKYM